MLDLVSKTLLQVRKAKFRLEAREINKTPKAHAEA
jgi:hypothetical protein